MSGTTGWCPLPKFSVRISQGIGRVPRRGKRCDGWRWCVGRGYSLSRIRTDTFGRRRRFAIRSAASRRSASPAGFAEGRRLSARRAAACGVGGSAGGAAARWARRRNGPGCRFGPGRGVAASRRARALRGLRRAAACRRAARRRVVSAGPPEALRQGGRVGGMGRVAGSGRVAASRRARALRSPRRAATCRRAARRAEGVGRSDRRRGGKGACPGNGPGCRVGPPLAACRTPDFPIIFEHGL